MDFGTDLKLGASANSQHKIEAFSNTVADKKKFDEYWERKDEKWKAITGKSIRIKIVYSNETQRTEEIQTIENEG